MIELAEQASSQPSWAWIVGIMVAVGIALWAWRREIANRDRQDEKERKEREGRYVWDFGCQWAPQFDPPALWLRVRIDSTGTRPVQIHRIAFRRELTDPGIELPAWKDGERRVHRGFTVGDHQIAELLFDAVDIARSGTTQVAITGSGPYEDVKGWNYLPAWDAYWVRHLMLSMGDPFRRSSH